MLMSFTLAKTERLAAILAQAPVIPVLTFDDAASGVATAKALRDGGLPVLEVTLRTPKSLEALQAIVSEVEGVIVGAGTVLETEHVAGRMPERPWTPSDLDAALDALEVVADVLTPVPAGLELPTFDDDHGGFVAFWDDLRADPPALPGFAEHLEEAAALAATGAAGRAGDTLVHGDLRDDNVLLREDGTAVFCDWNFPTRGAAWLDTVMLMIGPRGDGLDVDAVLADRRLTRDVPAADVDALIALITGYFLRQSTEPVPPTSPYLRRFQRWQGDVCWTWLAERRAWI
jgi:hypothetical protein